MHTLLQLHTSLNGTAGLSSSLADEYVERWRAAHPGGHLITRDLAAQPVPHLDADTFAAFATAPAARDQQQQEAVALSDELIAEIKAADEVVLAVPMHNFGVPSTLKAYFDHIARAGLTFRYSADGPVGLLSGKRASIVATRGGRYVGSRLDTQSVYLKNFLAFLGITDTRFVYAEGTALGAAELQQAVDDARAQIEHLSARAA